MYLTVRKPLLEIVISYVSNEKYRNRFWNSSTKNLIEILNKTIPWTAGNMSYFNLPRRKAIIYEKPSKILQIAN